MTEVIQRELEARIRRELPHLTEEDRCALARIMERLIDAYEPERIYLFGSKARGDWGPDSDFDLMVVVSDAAPVEQQRSRLAYERLWGTGTAADVLVWTHGVSTAGHIYGRLAPWHDSAGRETPVCRLTQILWQNTQPGSPRQRLISGPPIRIHSRTTVTADIVFHCQQRRKSLIKGFLIWHNRPFRKTHNLVEVGQQCTAIDASLEDLVRPSGETHRIRLEVSLSR